jgi:hypothetical protein
MRALMRDGAMIKTSRRMLASLLADRAPSPSSGGAVMWRAPSAGMSDLG